MRSSRRVAVVGGGISGLAAAHALQEIATERGLCINPRRTDLIEAAKGSSVPILDIRELKAGIDRLCGGAPAAPKVGDEFVAAIQWVDGTTIDGVRRVAD